MLHFKKTEQLLKSDRKTVWNFMSDPANLAAITPSYMGFTVLRGADRIMHPGQIIEYHVKPVAGINLHWVTEITHVKDQEYFVDEQRFGPYAFWHHQHLLIEAEEGILMQDLIHYKIPFGPVGKLANSLFVKKQLDAIFSFRFNKLEEIFNKK